MRERDIDELSAKFIEASEKLEQWENWWKEGSTDKSEAEPIDHRLEGLKPITEEERRQQPTTPFKLAKHSVPQEFLPPPLPPKFAHPRRANESEGSSHTGVVSQAMPTFAPTTLTSVQNPTMAPMPSSFTCYICRTVGSNTRKVAVHKSGHGLPFLSRRWRDQ